MTLRCSSAVKRHRLRRLPILLLMPHSRCNCRCVMCDIWKANRLGKSLDEAAITALAADLEALQTEEVVLSGGEALMHPNLWRLCAILKVLPLRITLLSTGLLLSRHAPDIVRWCDRVIVSLDGSRSVHDRIRNVPGAFDKLAAGVAALRTAQPDYPVSARCVVQRGNFRNLEQILDSAQDLGLDSISFLAADLSSTAFNRPMHWDSEHMDAVCLSHAEAVELERILEELIARRRQDFARGFIQENPDKLRRISAYYRAVHGDRDYPVVQCNAPWISAVVESDGVVRPCFFHDPIGRIGEGGLTGALNSPVAIDFREQLDVQRDATCRRCVCSLNR